MEEEIERLAPQSKSIFVREAIEEKIRKEKERRLEEAWVKALRKKPEDKEEAEDWLKGESWGDR